MAGGLGELAVGPGAGLIVRGGLGEGPVGVPGPGEGVPAGAGDGVPGAGPGEDPGAGPGTCGRGVGFASPMGLIVEPGGSSGDRVSHSFVL